MTGKSKKKKKSTAIVKNMNQQRCLTFSNKGTDRHIIGTRIRVKQAADKEAFKRAMKNLKN
jgi:hypothetical protein